MLDRSKGREQTKSNLTYWFSNFGVRLEADNPLTRKKYYNRNRFGKQTQKKLYQLKLNFGVTVFYT